MERTCAPKSYRRESRKRARRINIETMPRYIIECHPLLFYWQHIQSIVMVMACSLFISIIDDYRRPINRNPSTTLLKQLLRESSICIASDPRCNSLRQRRLPYQVARVFSPFLQIGNRRLNPIRTSLRNKYRIISICYRSSFKKLPLSLLIYVKSLN